MRVAVIVVTMLAATTSSEASQSCMSKGEARQHFGSVHLYWHGPDHCWDATSFRHRQVRVHRRPPIREVRRQSESMWHDAMSAILAEGGPAQPLTTAAAPDSERQSDDAVIGVPWADRWVNIAPSPSPLVARQIRIIQLSPEPVTALQAALMVSAHDRLVLTFIALLLTLGTIRILCSTNDEPTQTGRS